MQKNKAICFILAGMLSIVPFKEVRSGTSNLFQAEQSIENINIDRFYEIKEIEKLASETKAKRDEEEKIRKAEEDLERESKKQHWKFEVSFYCGCYYCTQNGNNITASGDYATEGVTVATPSDIPFGSDVYIEGLGDYKVQDRGGYIGYTYDNEGNLVMRLDVYTSDHNRALELGRFYANGYITVNNN